MSAPQRADIIGDLILDEFVNTEEGHCARVDFLERAESHAVCAVLRDSALGRSGDLCAFVLRPSAAPAEHELELDSVISADQAIERRNRKQERLCLFVPADIVDAAASSLGNAFAPIDGRDLHVQALEHLLANADEALSDTARRCFSRLRGQLRASETAKLDFFAAAAQRFEAGQPQYIGLELWRIGLLPDGGEDFQDRLDQNVRYVRELSQPQRVQAQLRERIQKLGVDEVTAGALLQLLDGRALNDVRAWARDIAATPLTLDRWVFPTQDRTDLRSVAVKSFLDVNGVVRKTSKLTQPFGASGALVANVGPKQKISIAWSSDPLRPSNLARWRVEIVPVSGELDDTTASLPSREVPSRRDSATLSLDLDLNADEIPNTMMWVRVLPLEAAGNEVLDDRGEPIVGTSEEFFLTEGEGPDGPTGRLKTVPTLPFGRLQALLKNAENIDEGQPQWVSRDLDYFTLRLNDRILVRVGLSPSLRALEGQVLNHPRQGGRYRLEVEDASAVDAAAFVLVAPPPSERDRWAAFWRARETFFRGVGRAEARSLIEVADWTPELANSAVRYAQAYRELVEELTARSGDDKRELIDALSLDTVYVRTLGAGGDDEVALIVLPTHPLRAAWFAGYSQLLLRWETQVAERAAASQPRTVDLELLEQASPPRRHPPCATYAALHPHAHRHTRGVPLHHALPPLAPTSPICSRLSRPTPIPPGCRTPPTRHRSAGVVDLTQTRRLNLTPPEATRSFKAG